ncbi:NYN domain-containing protein [Corynebacterium hindlerae]|uniref:NYN domain-containing protein n=1 Tax=Corynebacterium hindlerae TaxID=699041 RepID=UPI001AD71A27|nr:NYN domain-containing protein [Corynebacterium hindlerae]QTH59985.1 NYN domain-containing protein [Corynebacterium hindlerae]
MLERTLVYVDTSYLLASFYNSWETGARAQLEIDLPEVVAVLGNMIENQIKQPIHRQFWYDGIPDTGPHRYQRALRTCDGVQLRAGQLIEWGERRTQKAVDTRLVADLVLAGVRGTCSDIVLVSGDADMIPGVQEAVNAGVRVHLYGFGWDSMSSALRHACDSTTILDPREDFSECMQLQVLEGPLPPVVRTKPIGDAEPIDEDGTTSFDDVEPHFPARPGEPAVEKPGETEADCLTEGERNQLADAKPAEPVAPSPALLAQQAAKAQAEPESDDEEETATRPAPNPSMMAPRRKLRSRYVPLPNEVWASAGFQTPFDVGQQYASWWYDNAASPEQRDSAHLFSGGGLPPEIDRPLLQFACETLHEYTLTETQRVNLRDGFHSGIRGVLINLNRRDS